MRLGYQAIVQFLHRGAHVGLRAHRIARNVHQRIRLFRTGTQKPARAVIFERTPDQMHAIGQKRGGERIALEPGIAAPVKGETDGLGRSEFSLAGDAVGSGHHASPFLVLVAFAGFAATTPSSDGFGSPALYVAMNLSDTVWRTALKNRPQP